MPDAFPFIYQCQRCGAVQVVTRADVDRVDNRPRYAADEVLREKYNWRRARPDSICPQCST